MVNHMCSIFYLWLKHIQFGHCLRSHSFFIGRLPRSFLEIHFKQNLQIPSAMSVTMVISQCRFIAKVFKANLNNLHEKSSHPHPLLVVLSFFCSVPQRAIKWYHTKYGLFKCPNWCVVVSFENQKNWFAWNSFSSTSQKLHLGILISTEVVEKNPIYLFVHSPFLVMICFFFVFVLHSPFLVPDRSTLDWTCCWQENGISRFCFPLSPQLIINLGLYCK